MNLKSYALRGTAISLAGLAILSLANTGVAASSAKGDTVAGKKLFDVRCRMCHSVDGKPSPLGPPLRGVAGRKPGSAPGFKGYSPALAKLDGKWTPDRLSAFLASPAKFAPGTRMGVSVANPTQRADIVAYLQTVK